MNARKALFVLGGLIIALIVAVVAVALFTIHKMESEKNRAKTEKARQRRWANPQESETSELKVTPDGIVTPNQEDDEAPKDQIQPTD
jgi:hypothetical protein